jgi:hypothetical protein
MIMVHAVGIAWPVLYHLLHNWQAPGTVVHPACQFAVPMASVFAFWRNFSMIARP